jgi:hypothetical protein
MSSCLKDPISGVSDSGINRASAFSDLRYGAAFIAIGTKTGELVLYSYSSELGLRYETSLGCRNRRGSFKEGTPIVGIVWVTGWELLVASQDNRIRLVKIEIVGIGGQGNREKYEMSILNKFRGHRSSSGESPLAAFVLSPPFGQPVIECGSECGRVYVWPLPGSGLFPIRRSILKKIARKFKPSRALESHESWMAVEYPDRLTCASAAPWNPEKGNIGGSCTVTGSLDGIVRLFFNQEVGHQDSIMEPISGSI